MGIVSSCNQSRRSGVADWLMSEFQRISLHCLQWFFLCFIIANPGLSYDAWAAVWPDLDAYFTLMLCFSIGAHAWGLACGQ